MSPGARFKQQRRLFCIFQRYRQKHEAAMDHYLAARCPRRESKWLKTSQRWGRRMRREFAEFCS